MRFLACFIVTLSTLQVVGQNDPSTWPEPTQELINNGYYTKKKINQYYKWRDQWERENLPILYLYFDSKKERNVEMYEYGGGWNYEFEFELSPNLVFYVEDRPLKGNAASIKQVSEDSIKRIEYKDGDWLRKYFIENNVGTSKCLTLDRMSGDISILFKNPHGAGYLVMKPNNCVEEFE